MASLFCFYAFSPNYKYQVNIFRKGGSNIPEIQYWKRTVKEFIMQRKNKTSLSVLYLQSKKPDAECVGK